MNHLQLQLLFYVEFFCSQGMEVEEDSDLILHERIRAVRNNVSTHVGIPPDNPVIEKIEYESTYC